MAQQRLTKEALEAYRSQWGAVAQIEAEERRRTTVGQRLQQLNTLFQLAIALHLYEKAVLNNHKEAEVARHRWRRLKEKLHEYVKDS